MIVRRKSIITGQVAEMDLPVTEQQMEEFAKPGRRLVQDIFPELSPEQREFLMTGITPAEWEQHMKEEEE